MAKELTWFKFNVSEWLLGRIQKQPESMQGMFMNLCCKYWHKLGEYSLQDAFDDFDERRINSLIKAKILKVDENFMKISFLDEQLEERGEVSKVASAKGRKSAEIRAKKQQLLTTVEPLLNPVQPNSTEKRREEKRREEEKTREGEPARDFNWFKNQIDEIWLDQLPSDKKKNIARAIEEAWGHLFADKARLKRAGPTECQQLLNTWLSRMDNKSDHKNGIGKKQQHTAKIAASVIEQYSDVIAGGKDG